MDSFTVLLVAGGRGARMKDVTDECQKCMIPVDGKPIMAWSMDAIRDALSPEKMIIATGYHADQVYDYFGDKYQDIAVLYVHHDEMIGSRKRVLLADHLISGPFLFHSGDVVVPGAALRALHDTFVRGAECVLGTILAAEYHDPALSHGVICMENERIAEYIYPAPTHPGYGMFRSTGIAFFQRRYLDLLKQCEQESEWSGGIKIGVRCGEKFNVAVLKGLWYHFAYAEDIVPTMKFGHTQRMK
ncbi:MAG: NTP transferase domain-containing protein [Candidatus Sungbacteria bacterium]|uniref:NTP transferase domain-containing protein n=1 Tax=Candidatus Sungiibacteriota bacterium TaxID=2750080 RepID=A0A932QZT5_9BACT|nr:NTP transferase domain-containing protein [Candidatus Sungbacteria bacterium]